MTVIRVLLVDDHTIFREAIRDLLSRYHDIEIAGEAEDGREAVDRALELVPDLVVMDIAMRSLNGIDATRLIRRDRPEVKVVVLSMHGEPNVVKEALDAGVSGYLLKECATSELVQAIRLTFTSNQFYLSPAVAKVVVDEYLSPSPANQPPGSARLTPREREIMQMVAEGNTSGHIAERLCLSQRTVENHRARIMRKTGVSSVADLVKYAIREALTPP